MLDITSRGSDLAWLEQNLGLKSRQFRTLDWPLLAEIRAALATWRNQDDKKRRRSVRPNMLVKVLVRDREILVKNTLLAVVLAVDQKAEAAEPSESVIAWLIANLTKDLETIAPAKKFLKATVPRGAPPPRRPSTARSASGEDLGDDLAARLAEDEAAIQEQTRDKLLKSGLVRSCAWCPSKNAFSIDVGGARLFRQPHGIMQLRAAFLETSDFADVAASYDDVVRQVLAKAAEAQTLEVGAGANETEALEAANEDDNEA